MVSPMASRTTTTVRVYPETRAEIARRAEAEGITAAELLEIVLRRSLAADGKSRAFVNDEAVGVGLLKELGGMLLEVHGQQDDRGLFDIATHRGLLDGFGGLHGDAQTVALLHGEWAAARTLLEELKALADRVQPMWVSDHLCFTGLRGTNMQIGRASCRERV